MNNNQSSTVPAMTGNNHVSDSELLREFGETNDEPTARRLWAIVQERGGVETLRARVNTIAWQEEKRECARRAKAASEARSFRVNFGRVRFTLPKGFALAA